jgi:protein-S-isoprenylcysteine O-methyltransferase Ste14
LPRFVRQVIVDKAWAARTGEVNTANPAYDGAMDMDRTARPNTIPWPPLLYGGGAVLALLMDQAAPWPGWWADGSFGPIQVLGVASMAAGLALDLWAMAVMLRARANILPHRAATALVTWGPFAWSRNPIYLGNTMLLTGAGLAFGMVWLVLAGTVAAVLVGPLAIEREEAHLNARFGREWREYALAVRRWAGRSTRR